MSKPEIEFAKQFLAKLLETVSTKRAMSIVDNYPDTIRRAYEAGLTGRDAAERVLILRDNRLCISQPDLLAA